jgi:hypothetical protein
MADSQVVRLVLVLLLLCVAAPAVAVAQSPTVTPTAADEEDPGIVDDPGDAADEDVGDDDEVLQDEIPGDTNYCAGDGDYSYYEYCYQAVPNPQEDGVPAGAGEGGGKKPDDGVAPAGLAGTTAPTASALPRTGGEPLVLALMGLALIAIGTGGRLTLRRG